jgi:hypothetical protein
MGLRRHATKISARTFNTEYTGAQGKTHEDSCGQEGLAKSSGMPGSVCGPSEAIWGAQRCLEALRNP